MPGFDQTGPFGTGPMTGGGFGYCRGYASPDSRTGRNFDPGEWRPMGRPRGFRAGRRDCRWGLGRRYRSRSFFDPLTPEVERTRLKRQAQDLKASLADIENRLALLDRRAVEPKKQD